MKKKFALILVLALVAVFAATAADDWYNGMEISEFSLQGLVNVSESTVNNVLYPYRHKVFSTELFDEIQNALYEIDGIDFFTADADRNEKGGLVIVFQFYEIPMLSAINFDGNVAVKARELREAVQAIAVGSFMDPGKRALLETAKTQIQSLYESKGFLDVPVDYEVVEDAETNTFTVTFSVSEGMQTRIVSFEFTGNDHYDYSTLKKQVKSKAKSLFNNGYLDNSQLRTDMANLIAFYQKNGYIDVIVSEPEIEYLEVSNVKYREAVVRFNIVEGQQWFYGGMEVSGNTIFSDEEIAKVQSMKVGSVLNLESVQNEYSAVADLYYNQGYIYNGMDVSNERDDTTMTVRFFLTITEGPQATVEEIVISGLGKTKDYVMRRELEIKPGDVFSKEKLILSAQNLYNTGLLSNLDYDLMYGQGDNSVILDFKLEEGRTKDIQFGATFGGTLNAFPVSGFVQWTDHNLGGRGQELGINTTLSPDTQTISVSFGDNWFKDWRWSNSFSFSFTHSQYTDELQLGTGAPAYFNGRNSDETWPLGYTSAEQWKLSGNEYPPTRDLMNYDLFTFSLGYNTGYTFIFTPGRLSVYGGVSVSLNRAVYDAKFMPFEKLIYQYGQKWQFSNKISLGVQWDGRDYVTNTTKGYLLSTSVTYAGGFLGGLSNYIKLSTSAAGYLKLFSFHIDEDTEKNIMLCLSTSANFMFGQYYNYENRGYKFWDPKLGATKYEMLYIDGMTIGRGFGTVIDQSFLWDNMLEISYVLVDNVLQAELFVSATGVNSELEHIKSGINWYFAAGGGLKLKISGFPLGLYLVKNATYKFPNVSDVSGTREFSWVGGTIFHGKKETSGMSLVLAISTSLI